MRTIRQIFTLTLVVLATFTSVAAQSNTDRAREEINEGSRLYKAGDYVAAQQHFERALELNPTLKPTQILIARAIQQQYRVGVDTPENIAKGLEAVEAYKKVLADDPDNDGAWKATVFLYGQMKNDEMVREMLTQRAERESVSPEKRAEAYVILASRQWKCSYEITEQKENKRVIQKRDHAVIGYMKPHAPGDFDKAQQCATEGLKLTEIALKLEPDHINAWSYKANLLREMSKLSEMERNASRKAQYDKLAEEAFATQQRLTVEEKLRDDNESQKDESDQDNQPKKVIISGGVLNGKAISKPQPEYPPIARAARAQGTVTVQILVDEEGTVISARAVSGHPLLQQAAVEAARRARFSQTRLSGQLVRVSGVVTYNFVLQ